MGAIAIPLPTLVDVQAGRLVGVQVVSLVAGAHVAAEQVHAVVAAIVVAGQALVHVHAVLLVVRHQDVAGRALAVIAAHGVHARVRAAGVHVVLEFLAFVDILAGPEIPFEPETERAGATRDRRTVRPLLAVTVMGAVPVVAFTAIHQDTSSIVSLKLVAGRTQAPEGARQVQAGVRARRVLRLAFVDVVAERRILGILPKTRVATALVGAERVHALMTAVVALFQTLVDVHAGSVVQLRQSVTYGTFAGDRTLDEDADVRATAVLVETAVLANA